MSPRDCISAMSVSFLLFLQLPFVLPKFWKSWQPITLNCRTHVIVLSVKEPSHPRSCHLFKGQRGRPNKCLTVLMSGEAKVTVFSTYRLLCRNALHLGPYLICSPPSPSDSIISITSSKELMLRASSQNLTVQISLATSRKLKLGHQR